MATRGKSYKDGLTAARTYCFFKTDLDVIEKTGATPKQIMRLGVLALENNPQIMQRIRELEQTNSALVEKLQRTSKRLYELENPP